MILSKSLLGDSVSPSVYRLVAALPPRVVVGFNREDSSSPHVTEEPRVTKTLPEPRLKEKPVGVGQPEPQPPQKQWRSLLFYEVLLVCASL